MTLQENPRPGFRSALTLVVALCAALLLLRFAINDRATVLGWEVVRKFSLGELTLALLTLCYVLVSTAQWSAMKSTLKLTQESNTLTLRAWAVVHDFRFELAPGVPMDLRIALQNNGKLPALDGVMGSYTEIIDGPVRWPRPSSEIGDDMYFLIGPSGEQTTANFTVLPISQSDVDAIQQGKKTLVIVATFSYTDAIGTRGLTTLALVSVPGKSRLSYAPKGNTMR